MSHQRTVSESAIVQLRLPPELRDAIQQAATARGMTVSAWLRDAARMVIRLQDISEVIPDRKSRSAGELYDVIDGQRRWARVEHGEIKGIGYHDAKPDDGQVYVPVTHHDSAPFDLATHWREAPRYTLVDRYGTPDRVLCTYPVVNQHRVTE